MKIGIDLNLRQNEIQNGVFQNLVAAPETPKLGQAYFDSTKGKYGLYEGTPGHEYWAYYATLEDLQKAIDSLGTMAYEDKNDYYTKQDIVDHFWSNDDKTLATGNFKVETNDTNGKAIIWNEIDGGGIQYDSAATNGDTVFVGVHGDDQVGEFVSIYAKDKSDSTKTKRVLVNTDGAYYLKNDSITTTPNDEIATIGNVSGSIAEEEARATAAEQALDNKITTEQGRAEAAEAALDEAKADKATTLAGYNIQDAYTKDEVDAKMSSAFHYRGSVDYYADLPEYGNIEGDVWNIKYADPEHCVDAGDNVVWVELDESDESGLGGYWDVLAGIVDLSSYAKKTEVQAVQQELTEFKTNLKVVEFNPEIAVGASGYATWTIPHTHGEDVVVAVKEVSTKEQILVNITQNNNSVTIGINAEPNTTLAANTYKAIIIG